MPNQRTGYSVLGRLPPIDLDSVYEIALIGANRTYLFTGLGVNAAKRDDLTAFHISDGSAPQLMLGNELTPAAMAETRENFREWVTGNGLAELMHQFGLFLDEIHRAYLMAKMNAGKLGPKAVQKRDGVFTGIPSVARKAEKLLAETGLGGTFLSGQAGLSKMRNALVHNNGNVSLIHCTHPAEKELRVIWRTFRASFTRADGTEADIKTVLGKLESRRGQVAIHGKPRARVSAR